MMSSMAVVPNATVDLFTEERMALIRKYVANGAPQDDFEIFMDVCRRTGLDPISKQIHFISRKSKDRNGNWVDKWSWQTSIDGYRLIADRTGKYAGSDDAAFTEDGKGLTSATVTVYKMVQGQRCPFTATARWAEYCPPENQAFMWTKMPHTMLAKCAESLALRKAFPAELSGLYTQEEMEQAGPIRIVNTDTGEVLVSGSDSILEVNLAAAEVMDREGNDIRPKAQPYRPSAKSNYPPPAANRVSNGNNGPTPSQRNFMNGLAKDLGWIVVGQDGATHHNPEEMDLEVSQLYSGKTVDTLTVAEASDVIKEWQKRKADLIAAAK